MGRLPRSSAWLVCARIGLCLLAVCWLSAAAEASGKHARSRANVRVSLTPLAAEAVLPGSVDSNSPLFWNDLGEMVLFTSFGRPLFSVGPDLRNLTQVGEVAFEGETPDRKWMESVIRARDGTLYGYYHAEPEGLCPGSELTAPHIGAAVSLDARAGAISGSC